MRHPNTPSITELLDEFGREYLGSSVGLKQLKRYPRLRAAARENWELIQRHLADGREVTDLVLERLLPHLDTDHNREKGAWVHIAPAVTRDLKKWFENAKWVAPTDWPEVAKAILAFVDRVIRAPGELAAACQEFGASRQSKGFQSAFLSPILNALRPEDFLILNTKSFRTLSYLRGTKYSRRVVEYPAANQGLWDLYRELESELQGLTTHDCLSSDVLDQFCHWLVSVKKVAAVKKGAARDEGGSGVVTGPTQAINRSDPASMDHVVRRLFAEEQQRSRCVTFLADAIEMAHSHGAARWNIRLSPRSIRLRLGALIVLEFREESVRVGLALPSADEDTRGFLARESPASESSGDTGVATLYDLPAEVFLSHERTLRPLFVSFLAAAAGTRKKVVGAGTYSEGVLIFLERQLGRTLPRPAHAVSDTVHPRGMIRAVPIRTPRTVFRKADYDLAALLSYIENGDIGLPDIQRPFVWTAAKVRDLFDSMYRGFPVGYLLFWENSEIQGTKAIGLGPKREKVARLLIVDGQQRLTSLFAVMRGREVLDNRFRPMRLEIAFRPRDGRFEVSDAAVRQDPEFIPDIARLWTEGKSSYGFVSEFLRDLEAKRELTPEDKDAIGHNLDRLFDLQKYPFTAVEITPSVDEEAVSDIFVRINSEGVKLQQADFILTLLSVFWDEGRAALERFSRASLEPPVRGSGPSPFNYLIQPTPGQLLRVSIAVGFHRARLRSVYQVLRGKDVETGQFSPERRDEQFARLRQAQEGVLDLTFWHQFLGAITAAGFRTSALFPSETALLYAYALYLVGKLEHGVDERDLQRRISRWFFMVSLTSRYTGSPETTMESDLSRIKDRGFAPSFSEALEKIITTTLTNDFWEITVPSALETSSPRSPAWLAYIAAQNRLGVPVLFSDKRIWEAMDPGLRPRKKALEAHHLFPRAWLEKNGYPERRQFNQVANFAYLEWPDNLKVGAAPPGEYVVKLRGQFSDAAWERMSKAHALPEGWEGLEFPVFLARRRKLMSEVIRRGFEALSGQQVHPDLHTTLSTGTDVEQDVWRRIQELELSLRRLIRRKYEEKWGGSADSRIRAALGEQSWSTVERSRGKHAKQYRATAPEAEADTLDFCYLGQLGQLMVSNEAWELFRSPFRDRRELEDKIADIVPVRNDGAHFRSTPDRELGRCRLAVGDLLSLISRI